MPLNKKNADYSDEVIERRFICYLDYSIIVWEGGFRDCLRERCRRVALR